MNKEIKYIEGSCDDVEGQHKYILIFENSAGKVGIRPAIDNSDRSDRDTNEVRIRIETNDDYDDLPYPFEWKSSEPLHASVTCNIEESQEFIAEAISFLREHGNNGIFHIDLKNLKTTYKKASNFVTYQFGKGWH